MGSEHVPSYMGLGAPNWLPKKLSTASTNCALDANVDSGRLLIWNGQTSAARITLPTPEFGLAFKIVFNADAASSGTIITATSNFDIIMIGSTYCSVQFNSTSEEGQFIEFIGLSDNRYLAMAGSPGAVHMKTSNSTVSWDGLTS